MVAMLLFTIASFAPTMPTEMIYNPIKLKAEKEFRLLNENMIDLKDDTRKTRTEVYNLVQPVMEMYLEEYVDNYVIGDSLSHALACIFVSESSNGKGHSGRSTLWLTHSNPFGMTTSSFTNSTTKMSWEMIKGKRVNMYRTFKSYETFEEAIESLMWDYLLKARYFRLREAETVKDFLYSLYDCGYMTNSRWPFFAYNEIYLTQIVENKGKTLPKQKYVPIKKTKKVNIVRDSIPISLPILNIVDTCLQNVLIKNIITDTATIVKPIKIFKVEHIRVESLQLNTNNNSQSIKNEN